MTISLSTFNGVKSTAGTKESPLRTSGVQSGMYDLTITKVERKQFSGGSPWQVFVSYNGMDIRSELLNEPGSGKFPEMATQQFLRFLEGVHRNGTTDSVFEELQEGGALAEFADNIDALVDQMGSGDFKLRCLIQAGHQFAWKGSIRKTSKIVDYLSLDLWNDLSAREAAGETIIKDSDEYAKAVGKADAIASDAVNNAGTPSFGGAGGGAPTGGVAGSTFAPPSVGA